MVDLSLETIKRVCGEAVPEVGAPFIDARLAEYKTLYAGAYPYYNALLNLTRVLKPGVVVEIGTWEGTSAACFAAGNAETAVFTIDHHSDPGDQFNYLRTVETLNLYQNLTYFQGCSTEMVAAQKPNSACIYPKIVERLAGRTIDVLFIDGWHGGEYARADFDTYRPLLSSEALVICDDIYGADCDTLYGMKTFWEELPGEKYLDPVIHSVYSMGFSIIRKE